MKNTKGFSFVKNLLWTILGITVLFIIVAVMEGPKTDRNAPKFIYNEDVQMYTSGEAKSIDASSYETLSIKEKQIIFNYSSFLRDTAVELVREEFPVDRIRLSVEEATEKDNLNRETIKILQDELISEYKKQIKISDEDFDNRLFNEAMSNNWGIVQNQKYIHESYVEKYEQDVLEYEEFKKERQRVREQIEREKRNRK